MSKKSKKQQTQEKATYIMLVGLPASGKTTWAKEFIENNKNFVLVSTDEIYEEFAKEMGVNYTEAFSKVSWKTVSDLFNERLEKAFYENKNIIHDQTNLTKNSRTSKLSKVPVNYTKYVKVFSENDSVLTERLQNRSKETGKTIPYSVIKKMQEDFDVSEIATEGFDVVL